MAEPTKRDRVDLINFIMDATADDELARNFLQCTTAEEVRNFFQKAGYHDIPLNDCEDILEASQKMHGCGVSSDGNPVSTSHSHAY